MTPPKNAETANRPDPRPENPNQLPPEKYARLKDEALHPFRGLRRFLYGAAAASGALGGFVFFAQVLAGRDLAHAIPNLGVQVGVVALMVWLLRRDRSSLDG
jgi:hypothetical protein